MGYTDQYTKDFEQELENINESLVRLIVAITSEDIDLGSVYIENQCRIIIEKTKALSSLATIGHDR